MRFTVPTGSMWPALYVGDSVSVCGFIAGEARPGDLLVSNLGAGWRVHRLIASTVERGERVFITKGDNTLSADEPWAAEAGVGLVVTIHTRRRDLDTRTAPARAVNRVLALLSRIQWEVYRHPPPRGHRVLIKGLQLLLCIGGYLTRLGA